MFQENQTTPNTEQVDTQTTAPVSEQAPEVNQIATQMLNVDSGEKLFSAICYIPVFSILTVPLTLSKYPKSAYCALHSANGLGIFALWFVSIFLAIFPAFIGSVVWLLLLILSVWGGFSAFSGKEINIPLVHSIGVLLVNAVKPLLGQVNKVAGAAGGMVNSAIQNTTAQTGEAPVNEAPVNEAPVNKDSGAQTGV